MPVAVFTCGLAMLALAAFIAWRMRGDHSPHAPPSVSNPDQPIAALSAEFTTASGALITARLAPLHADAGRQSFESVSMRERLALPAGEPWRLSLRYESTSSKAAGDGAGLALGAVEISDERGVALSSIPNAADGTQPADPLRALVVAPSGTLQLGQGVDWVLWGRPPAAHAHLTGLAGVALEFRAQDVRRSELSLPLARLDRSAAGAGKKSDTAASAGEDTQGDHAGTANDHH